MRPPPAKPIGAASPLKPTLSPAEERFERLRRSVGLFAGPVAAVAILLAPLPLAVPAHRLAAILAWVVVYWMTEAIPLPVTALLGAVLCAVAAVAPVKEVFAPFAHPVIFLFIGSFLLAEAMIVHGLDRRLALVILSRPAVAASPARLLLAFGGITVFISMWISNTAATAMIYPIAVGILSAVAAVPGRGASAAPASASHVPAAEVGGASAAPASAPPVPPGVPPRYGTGLMLMVAYGASVGGIGTLIGTPPNLIGAGLIAQQAGVKISFLQWMSFAVPLVIAMLFGLYGLLARMHPPGAVDLGAVRAFVRSERAALGPMTRGERNAAAAFAVAVALWVIPGAFALAFGAASPQAQWIEAHLPEAVVAVAAATLLFVLPVDWEARRFTLDWEQAQRIDWGTILLFGGGLALGDLMFKTGLAEVIGRAVVDVSRLESLWSLTAVAIALGIVVSELTSNTASANMVIPVMIAVAAALGLNPVPPALGACLGASYGFMLPISTPPNAIVYGSGLVPILSMVRAGVLFDLLGFGLIWLGLRLLLPLVGLA